MKFEVKYKGKIYQYPEELSKVSGVPTKKITARWRRGIRDINKLTYLGKLQFTKSKYNIYYDGKVFDSMIVFCDTYDLSYARALGDYRLGITDGAELIKRNAKRNHVKRMLSAESKNVKEINNFANKQGLITPLQLAKRVNLPYASIFQQIVNFKNGGSLSFGIHKSDIVKINYKDRLKLSSNLRLLGEYVFKSETVQHILNYSKIEKDFVKIPLPLSNDSYFLKENKVYSSNSTKHGFYELQTFHHDSYRFKDKAGKTYSLTIAKIKDLINHPEIKAEDLMNKNDVIQNLGLTTYIWDNRRIFKYLSKTNQHTRWFEDGTRKEGWTKSEVNKIVKENPNIFKSKKA